MNTGGVTFGDNDGDTITFTGGLDTTAGTTTARGTINTTDTQMDIGAVTLAGTTVFDTGTAATSIMNIGAVTGASNDLTLDSGANAAADITVASVSNVGTLTIRDSGGTTISGTTGATTVTLTDTTGAVTFGGAITATTLNTAAQPYSVVFNDGGTITNDTTFLNTGGVTFGDNDGDTITFTGGLDTTAGTTTARGTINTTNTQMDIGAVTLAGATTLDTGTGAASIMNIGAVTGASNDLTLDSGANAAADITVVSMANVNNLVATAGGDIIQGGAFDVNGTSSFTVTGTNTITLTNTSNDFTGAISLNSGTGLVQLTDSTDTVLNTSNLGGNLVVSSSGNITDIGALSVTGTSSFTASVANRSITLDTATNSLAGTISFSTTGTGDVTLDNGTTATNLGTVSVGRNLSVTAGNAITDSGVLTVGGNATFTTDVANQSITLDTTTNAISGAISFSTTGTGNVTLDNGTTATILGTVSIGQNLSVTAGNSIQDTGTLTVDGTSSFTTDVANQSITLDTSTNALTGAISFSTTGTGDVTLDNGTTATNLGTVSVGRNLSVTAGGAITDSGVFTIGGTSSFTTDVANQSITLDTATNTLTGAVAFNTSGTGDATLTYNGTITLAASTVGDALTVNATGLGSSINVNGNLNAASILLTADDDVILNSGTLTASGSGNSLTLATVNGGDFTNNVGAGVLSAASGRWLIYAADPLTTTLGGLTPDQTAFNTTYPTIPGSFAATDNGVIYGSIQVIPPSPIEPPGIDHLVDDLESNDSTPVNLFILEDSLVVSEQKYQMEILLNENMEDLMNIQVGLDQKKNTKFVFVETYSFLNFAVMNELSPEDLLNIKVEPPEKVSRTLNFAQAQKLLEDEMMLHMTPEELMKVKVEQREKIIKEISVMEPEEDFDRYVECSINPLRNIWESSCINI